MTELLYKLFKSNPFICTDTRNVTEGAIFFALKGENFNGNEFAETALEKGCRYAVIDESVYKKDDRFIVVNDTLKALQDLAKHHREQLNIPFIAVTGSNGKTTTKELINAVLSKKYKTHATKGNLNNHIGVPLTILSIPDNCEIAIIEMGANHQKEIEFLCTIAMPDYGLITNIGKAHLEGFGGIEGIKKGKGELFAYLSENGGRLFLNADSEILVEMASNIHAITYGSFEDCYTRGSFFAADPYVRMEWSCETREIKSELLETSIVGKYNYSNILAAICIGNFFEVETTKINEAIKNYISTNNRSQIIKTKKNYIILDAYNANPSSMEEALNNFEQMKAETKVVILGDMLELGDDSITEHKHLVEKLMKINPDRVLLVGPVFGQIECSFEKFFSSEELKHYLANEKISGATVLIKGSRGIMLEKVTEVL